MNKLVRIHASTSSNAHVQRRRRPAEQRAATNP